MDDSKLLGLLLCCKGTGIILGLPLFLPRGGQVGTDGFWKTQGRVVNL